MASSLIPMTNSSSQGYCKMGDGTLLQWGYTSVSALTTPVDMPLDFKDTTYYVQITLIANSNTATNVTAVTTLSTQRFSFGVNTNPSGGAYWLAIGRWK